MSTPSAPFSRNLGLLWGAQFVSQVGDFIHAASVVFLVLLLVPAGEGAAFKAGLVSFLETVPFLLVGFLAGTLADRVDRKRLMIASDLVRAGLLLVGLPLLVWSGTLTWWSLGIVTFLLGLASTPFIPARDALLPELAAGRNLLHTNAFFQTSQQLAMVLGTMLASLFLASSAGGEPAAETSGIIVLLLANGASFLVSCVLLSGIRLPAEKPRPVARPSFAADVRAGLARVRGDRVLLGLLLLTALNNFFIMGPASVGANLYIKSTLGMGAGELAALSCGLAVGWLLGTLWIRRWGSRFSPWKLLMAGMVADGLTYVPFFWIRDYGLAVAAMVAHGMAIPFISAVRTSLIQERVEREMLGKVFSLVNLTVVGFTALSQLATGYAGLYVSPPLLFLLAGSGGAACGLIGCAFVWRAGKPP